MHGVQAAADLMETASAVHTPNQPRNDSQEDSAKCKNLAKLIVENEVAPCIDHHVGHNCVADAIGLFFVFFT